MATTFPDKFQPSASYCFPNRKFGKHSEERSFRAEWCQQFDWLHYNRASDAAFSYICMQAENERKFLGSTKRDQAFITKGFTNWRDATKAFKKHVTTSCHSEAILTFKGNMADIGELLSTEHQREKSENRAFFRIILQNIRFLARQGLPLRGHEDETDSNFIQLLNLRAIDTPGLGDWMKKKTNKYTSHDIQNEVLHIMALGI